VIAISRIQEKEQIMAIEYPDQVIATHRFQYCPMCKADLVRSPMFADNLPRTHCAKCGWTQLVSDCVCVAVIVWYEDGIVAIHSPDGKGPGFPAGIVEYGENPREAAIREVLEETGLEVEIARDMGWSYVYYIYFPGPTVYLLFEARATGGTLREGDEGPAQVYKLEELPPISAERHGSFSALKRFLEIRAASNAAGLD
jgi:8-oxo-dGTP diphosphatase